MGNDANHNSARLTAILSDGERIAVGVATTEGILPKTDYGCQHPATARPDKAQARRRNRLISGGQNIEVNKSKRRKPITSLSVGPSDDAAETLLKWRRKKPRDENVFLFQLDAGFSAAMAQEASAQMRVRDIGGVAS